MQEIKEERENQGKTEEEAKTRPGTTVMKHSSRSPSPCWPPPEPLKTRPLHCWWSFRSRGCHPGRGAVGGSRKSGVLQKRVILTSHPPLVSRCRHTSCLRDS
ncbi:uncharacterized protein LOC135094692 [Scylla paramamosain]|uniref:uncharacterized protein LOC135094692 n=1 Tax=Scylla paramamosain TaxID=85552 RepID=UPI003082E982